MTILNLEQDFKMAATILNLHFKLTNSCNTDIFLSSYYHLQSVRFELSLQITHDALLNLSLVLVKRRDYAGRSKFRYLSKWTSYRNFAIEVSSDYSLFLMDSLIEGMGKRNWSQSFVCVVF